MPNRTKNRFRGDPSPPLAPAKPPIPVQTTFRHLPSSPAILARIDAEAQKLRRYYDGITHCQVVIVAPHRRPKAVRHAMHLKLSVPNETLVIANEPPGRPSPDEMARSGPQTEDPRAHEDIYVTVRQVFDSARRRLQDYSRRQRGDVKHHADEVERQGSIG